MIELIFATIFTVALRMLMGHLAIKYTVLADWLIYFKIIMIVVATVTAVWVFVRFVIGLVEAIQRARSKRS